MDAVYLWDLNDLNAATLSRQKAESHGTVEEGAHVIGAVNIGENTVIRSGCYIVGPVSIGDNCDIGPDTVILPSTSIGSNTTIEPFVRISNSILMSNARISSFSHLTNTIIGEGTSTGPAFIAESDHTKVEVENMLMRANIGAIVGDNTEIAGRVLVKPGRIIGVRCKIGSGTIIWANVGDNTRVL
jgi:glucose-1-phosphate thymidylyltransferase